MRVDEDYWLDDVSDDSFISLGGQHVVKDKVQRFMYHAAAFLLGKRRKNKTSLVQEISDVSLNRFASGLTAIVAGVVPTLSILVLYGVHRMWIRIGLVIAFTTCFAALLTFVMHASRFEVFAGASA